DDVATRHFDRHREPLGWRIPGQLGQPRGEPGPGVRDRLLGDAAARGIEHTYLMPLGAPIDSDVEVIAVRHGLLPGLRPSERQAAVRVTPVPALEAQLPTGRAPRHPRWGAVHSGRWPRPPLRACPRGRSREGAYGAPPARGPAGGAGSEAGG